MTETRENTQLVEDNERDEVADDTISRLFEERNENLSTRRSPSAQTKEKAEEKKEVSVLQDDQKGDPKDENVKADNKKPNTASSDASDKDPEFDALRSESDKLQKELESTKKWGHTNSRKLKKAILTTKEFVENGDISEEEGQRLLEILESSGSSSQDEDSDGADPRPGHPFAKIFKVANTELENIRKYTGDTRLDDKVKAFDYFLSVASVEEQQGILEEFTDLINHPIELTKKMLSMGQKCFEESYGEIQEAGGFKGYIDKKKSEIDKLTKTIDKLTKKLLQYEDYDRPTYSLNEMGSSEDGKAKSGDSVDNLFEVRDRAVAVRR
jgi:hypothetical protein